MSALPGFSHESQNAKTVEWYTPPWVFEALGLSFDLDPCSPPGGLPWVPAVSHYSAADNGLIREWRGRVWLNPPYGDLTSKFLARMHEHRHGVALVFARTDTNWFHNYAAKADAILFIHGRLAFVPSGEIKGKSGAGAGSALIAWNDDCVSALRKMMGCGLFWEREPRNAP